LTVIDESTREAHRIECARFLNSHDVIRVLEELVESWRMEYNTDRPHGALGGETPAAYAADLEQENRKAA
jgi:transposase InsO family protein